MQTETIIPDETLDRHWHESGLVEVIADAQLRDTATSETGAAPIAPESRDLARLHYLVRERRYMTTLEFGIGYSTIAMAHALSLNKKDFEAAGLTQKLRNSRLFEHVGVDTSRFWLERMERLLPSSLRSFVTLHHSDAEAGIYEGQLCHFYTDLPNVIADFIYLDGPDPSQVKGSVRGLDFSIPERTVMSADLLFMEPCFLPGTAILVDGRTNNVRFLERNFRRSYTILWDREGDCTLFNLDEEKLGPHNIHGTDLF